MEVPQGNSLCSYLQQAKISFFSSFHKITEQEWWGGGVRAGGLIPVGVGRMGVGIRGWMWCKHCLHMYINGKMIPVEIIPGMRGGEIKENGSWS
jgi:hypothetical protein